MMTFRSFLSVQYTALFTSTTSLFTAYTQSITLTLPFLSTYKLQSELWLWLPQQLICMILQPLHTFHQHWWCCYLLSTLSYHPVYTALSRPFTLLSLFSSHGFITNFTSLSHYYNLVVRVFMWFGSFDIHKLFILLFFSMLWVMQIHSLLNNT